MSQAYYSSTIANFIDYDTLKAVGQLNVEGTYFSHQWTRTTTSWINFIEILKKSLSELVTKIDHAISWTLYLEYEIPRLQSRIDAVVIADDLIFVIEYKDDRKIFETSDQRQVEDYALDLKDFHLESRGRKIIPILLIPYAKNIEPSLVSRTNEVFDVLKTNSGNFSTAIVEAYSYCHDEKIPPIDPVKWDESKYSPTPTIVQAAQALYEGQKVENITKYEADNLSETTSYLVGVIKDAQKYKRKIICFVTGVPGAGKTLVGLSIIHREEFTKQKDWNAAYFSGNGPLIKVLREALTRDEYYRKQAISKKGKLKGKITKEDSFRKVKTKIQDLHKFIKDGIRNKNETFERIVVFDEAQRCWNAQHFFNQTARNQNRVKKEDQFDPIRKSEAEILFEIMDKYEDWAVIVALVGGGQEINTGEAGIQEWGKVLSDKYKHWHIYISPELLEGDSSISGSKLFNIIPAHLTINKNENLHLSVSHRSFRAENLNDWVNNILDNNHLKAKEISQRIFSKYPIYITRDLAKAKLWLKSLKQGNKRIGLVASSGALRLRSYGISPKEGINEAYWFLNDENDVRSSDYLEIAATEYAIQGLEIDWSCLCWDADLRRNKNGWDFKNFSGTKWTEVHKESERHFILNTYRVLLTRAREGMVLWVPLGDDEDKTRDSKFYSPIYEYLKACGIQDLPS